MATLVDLQRVTTSIFERTLFSDLSLTISAGERVGVVGINGTGKSTLLRVIAGEDVPDQGKVLRARDLRVGYLEQDPKLARGTVLNAVGEGWESRAVLERVGLGDSFDRDVSELSGGQAKRVALARVLVQPCDLLVLDEPTNHLDLVAVDWLEERLSRFRGGLVMVSHDRHLLDRVVNKMVELDRGEAQVHSGGYGAYLEAKAAREELAVANDSVRRNLARRELAWLRRGAPARTRKPQARVEAARRLIDESGIRPARAGDLEIAFGTPRLGDRVITATDCSFTFAGAASPTLRNVSIDLDPRERLGIVGLNGSGKSTLLDLLAQKLVPTFGAIEVGTTAVVGYYDQRGVELDPDARVRELVAGKARVSGSPEDNALMEKFWFTKDLPFARVSSLSGGERRRLQLLLVLAHRPNVVLLDEPTNDLDLDTLRVVEDFFDDWPGALVVVSHDRTFLDRTVDRLLAIEPDGSIAPVVGGVAAYVEHLTGQRLAVSHLTTSKLRRSREPVPRSVRRSRSTSTLGRLLHETEKTITRITRERDGLLARMSETTDYIELASLGRSFDELHDELVVEEHRWLELSEEADAIT